MYIIIKYHEKTVIAKVIGDYKVSISQRQAGIEGKVVGNDPVELDQCKECGVWASLDDELYGDGYCAQCSSLCGYCEQYFCYKNMYQIGDSDIEDCCTKCADKHHPNFKKYIKAIDDFMGVEIIKKDIRVTLEYIGEGTSGVYTKDEKDVPLIRFYICKKEYVADNDTGIDHPDWNWGDVDFGTRCTQIPVDAPTDILNKFARLVLNIIESYVENNDNIRRFSDEFSCATIEWVNKQK